MNVRKTDETSPEPLEVTLPTKFKTRAGQMKLIIKADDELEGGVDPDFIANLAQAQRWFEQLRSATVDSVQPIATAEQFSRSYVAKVLRLAFQAPDIIDAILAGHQPAPLSARKIRDGVKLPREWDEQRRILGFAAVDR